MKFPVAGVGHFGLGGMRLHSRQDPLKLQRVRSLNPRDDEFDERRFNPDTGLNEFIQRVIGDRQPRADLIREALARHGEHLNAVFRLSP